ncbi:MAG: 50S ribosomal protein L18 [Thermoguttaceae bacterium]
MKKFKRLNLRRKRRAFRVANAVKRYSTRPRLCVFRSNKHIFAQIIDDNEGKTLVSAGTNDKDLRSEVSAGGNCEAAAKIGEIIAKKALAAGIQQVAFDRHGYLYHGRIRSLADAARNNGLDIGPGSDRFTEEELAERAKKKGTSSGTTKKKDVNAQVKKGGGQSRAPKKK